MTDGTKSRRVDIDPSLLPTFLAVVQQRTVSAAALTLNISQPAVTARINRLEESVGVALFERSVRGVEPTAAARRLEGYARSIQSLLDQAATSVNTQTEALGALSIVASTTIAGHVLPSLLARFRARYSQVPLSLTVANTKDVIAAIKQRQHHLGLVEGHGRAAGVRLVPFVDDELVPMIGRATRHTFARTSDLASLALLWRERGSGTRAVLARAFRDAGLPSKPRPTDIVLGSTEAIIGAAAAGLGVAFLSRWSARAQINSGGLRPIPGLDFVVRRSFRWAMPAGGLSPSAARFHAVASESPPSHVA